MANNAIFARLANLWTGFVSLWVSDVEKAHPEIAYQNAIASMIEKYTQLKAATGAIIARRQEITARLDSACRYADLLDKGAVKLTDAGSAGIFSDITYLNTRKVIFSFSDT